MNFIFIMPGELEVRDALDDISIWNKPFSDTVGTAPLHWHMADADPDHGGLILEITSGGMRIYPDEAGVLSNEPPYPDQLNRLTALPYLRGDAVGLPGEYSSPSRFLRASTLRRWWMERGLPCAKDGEGGDPALAQFFTMLGAVSPTAGAIMTPDGESHRTLYTCCMDTGKGVYYYRTEGEAAVSSVSFDGLDLNGESLWTVASQA